MEIKFQLVDAIDVTGLFPHRYPRLAGVLSCVRLMADSKEAMATATEMATQIGKNTTLGHARATLNLMTTCLHEAAAAKTQDAPEVPPLKTQIARVGPIVIAKQEVHDSTVAPVNGKMTVEHLRGPVTQRMLTAKKKAEVSDLRRKEIRRVDCVRGMSEILFTHRRRAVVSASELVRVG